jgi:hypothetical protein
LLNYFQLLLQKLLQRFLIPYKITTYSDG